MYKDICPVIFSSKIVLLLPLPLSWLKAPWADQSCFTPSLKRLLFRMSFMGLLLKAHCCLLAGWEEELDWVGTHCLETVQASATRMPRLDLQVKQLHRALPLFKVTQEESVKHSDCVTKYWEVGISKGRLNAALLWCSLWNKRINVFC